MTSVTFNRVSKYYGDFAAVEDLNLSVEDQEFLVLVGPSGCGKTTSLRMLAGLEDISIGTIHIGDRIVNEEPPKARDIAMVFQSYALYPHWTIYENLAFGLRMRNVSFTQNFLVFLLQAFLYIIVLGIFYGFSYVVDTFLPSVGALLFISGLIGGIVTLIMFAEVRHDIRRFILNLKLFPALASLADVENDIEMKVRETSTLLGIHEQLFKKPKQLSGGQRQRVALGRAIIRAPEVFLMDEPLSNLDAKLRVQMRAELQRMQKRLKTTTIYVTHDQIEAMTLADRIAIMNKGVLQQVGTPDEVYTTPVNKFVAGFIGSPSMNFSDGKINENEGELYFECEAFRYPVPEYYRDKLRDVFIGKPVWLGIRPEHIQLTEYSSTPGKVNATVGVLEPIGSDTYVYIDFPKEVSMIVKVEGAATFKLDEELDVTFLPEHIHFFHHETGNRITPEEQ
jgi:multiple sugar transport system ATP-binding protein